MRDAPKRSILRWSHLVLAIPIIGYIYSPFERLPDYAPLTRFVFLPLMALSGCGCGKGAWFGGLFRRDRLLCEPSGKVLQRCTGQI